MTAAASTNSAEGLRLFIVEDEALVAMLLEDVVTDLGCVVVAIAGSVRDALNKLTAWAESTDAAVLDVNLGGEKVFPVADQLADHGIPFLFVTGYGRAGVGDRYPAASVLAKPYSPEALAKELSALPRRTAIN